MPSLKLDDIVTPRLDLITITPDALRVQQNANGDHHTLATLIRCAIPSSWPIAPWEPSNYDFLFRQFAEHPDQLGWPRYIALRTNSDARALIGMVGAFSKTDPPTVCEIGYGVHPDQEGRGFTTEAASAVIQYLRSNPRVETIIAHTFPSLPASIRVMEKCGMVFDGDGEDEPGTIRYRLDLRC